MVKDKETPVLIDPAIYFGNREMDIAMCKLFGGFHADFYASYNEEFPLESDWEGLIWKRWFGEFWGAGECLQQWNKKEEKQKHKITYPRQNSWTIMITRESCEVTFCLRAWLKRAYKV